MYRGLAWVELSREIVICDTNAAGATRQEGRGGEISNKLFLLSITIILK